MKSKFKECIIISLLFSLAIGIHYLLSFPISNHTGDEQMAVFGILAMFASIGWLAWITSILTHKEESKNED